MKTTPKLTLLLEHCKNPDIAHDERRGYWQPPTDPRAITLEGLSLPEAKAAFIAWRDRNGLGGGNMTQRTGEYWMDGRLLGAFAYNGRFFYKDGTQSTVVAEAEPVALRHIRTEDGYIFHERADGTWDDGHGDISCGTWDEMLKGFNEGGGITFEFIDVEEDDGSTLIAVTNPQGQVISAEVVPTHEVSCDWMCPGDGWLRHDVPVSLAIRAQILVALLREARSHIDVSLIRTSTKAHAKWETLATKLDAELLKH